MSLILLIRHRMALTVHGTPREFRNTWSDVDRLRRFRINLCTGRLRKITRAFPTLSAVLCLGSTQRSSFTWSQVSFLASLGRQPVCRRRRGVA